MIYDRKVTLYNDVRDIDDKGTHLYKLYLRCDECENIWSTTVSNWRKKEKNPVRLDFCKYCLKKGERNPSFGKDRSAVMEHARKFQTVNGMSGKHHSPETRALQSKSKVDLIAEGKFDIKSCNRGRKSYYVSTKSNIQFHADSILELARMIELDNSNDIITWTKYHQIRIPYVFENISYNYVPDFFMVDNNGNKIIEEVKGRIIPRDLEKQNSCIEYCNNNGYIYRMITGKDLLDLKNYKKLLKEIK
jgi:NUMOD3 motif